MEMRWQLMLTELMQPVMDRESARAHQRLFSELWRLTSGPEERQAQFEQAKSLIEEITGVPLVRRVKKNGGSS